MRAVRMTAPGVLELTEVPTPEPGPGEVLLRVGAVGACHSDLHILDAEAGLFPTPMTLGHEIAGTVEAAGSGVDGWSPGDRRRSTGSSAAAGAGPACAARRTAAGSPRSVASGSAATAGWPSTSWCRRPGSCTSARWT